MYRRITSLLSLCLFSLLLGGSFAFADTSHREAEAIGKEQLTRGIETIRQNKETARFKQARTELQKLADSVDSPYQAEANLWLGRLYRDGLAGAEKDLHKALLHFERAAGKEGLNPEAQFELGRAYFQGEGTDRNLIAAYMWTTISLRQETDVSEKALIQQQKLTRLLTAPQLETARTLVTQMETIYLKKSRGKQAE